jgi:hypothetical protein
MNVVEQINAQATFLNTAQAITGAQTVECLKLLTLAVQANFDSLGVTELYARSDKPAAASEAM